MFKFTSHAIERYCGRVEPGLRYHQALKRLEFLAAGATPKKANTESGQQQWVIDDPRCAFIVKRVKDKNLKRNINLVVTILGEDEMARWDEANNEDSYSLERELYEEYQADLAARQQKAKDSAAAMKIEAEAAKQIHTKRGYQYDPGNAVLEEAPEKKPKPSPKIGWAEVLAMIASEHKAVCKYEAHRETILNSVDRKSDALREALKTLHDMMQDGSQTAHACMERIKDIDEGFVKQGFIYNTKMENRRLPKDS